MRKPGFFIHLFFAVIATFIICSCGNTKRLIYVNDLPETNVASPISIGTYTEMIIQPDDKLAINITTNDAAATLAINSRNGVYVNGGTPSNGSANPLLGFLVKKDGFVDIPILGSIKLGGLTTIQARAALKERALKSFIDPVVDVRFSNFKITVLGEVNNPAPYIIPNERVTVFDAIGLAGDLTIYGRRSNVLIIHKGADGKNYSTRVDLRSKEVLNSPYFYLKQNDIVYVEPLKTKVLNNDTNLIKYLSLAATLLSTAIFAKRYY